MYARTVGQCLFSLYDSLNIYFGDLHWWPGESPFEVIVGAILTQNTAWHNVEIAIDKLKSKGLLHPERILETENEILAELIRPSGYYRIKTRRLKSFVQYLHEEYDGSLERMFLEDFRHLREKLLRVKGIGEETADSILLYAGEKPIFVVDAYTRRILQRHDIICEGASYGEIQKLFMTHLPHSVPLYKQYHALLVNTGKTFCTKTPRCEGCPLHKFNYTNMGTEKPKCFT
ncbi:MAG: endonuclease III domain-containing protein [Syntrophales bacterium]|nr:endonuclease III domain-containing protein [Syntrophales bacterium]